MMFVFVFMGMVMLVMSAVFVFVLMLVTMIMIMTVFVIVIVFVMVVVMVAEMHIELYAFDAGLLFAADVKMVTVESQSAQFVLQLVGVHTKVDQRAQEHVAADAAEGVEVKRFHLFILFGRQIVELSSVRASSAGIPACCSADIPVGS